MANPFLTLVSMGPGQLDLLPPRALAALEAADVIIGYGLYLEPVSHLLEGKEVLTPTLTREKERAELALAKAREGKRVALVSSGDIGVYAMASLVYESLPEDSDLPVELVPGITAATSCGSLLGAPLAHDFATLSLSDLLCPWEWIEMRAQKFAEADVAVALYNVQSKTRQTGVYRVLEQFAAVRGEDVPCGIVRNAYRPDQSAEIVSLAQLRQRKFDMLTTLIIGTTRSYVKRGHLVTPRGYLGFASKGVAGAKNTEEELPPAGAIWVFGGTSEGRTLAKGLLEAGEKVVVSSATAMGREFAASRLPVAFSLKGGEGVEARRRLFKLAPPKGIIDATHPFAAIIGQQLVELTNEAALPLLRYERPEACAAMPRLPLEVLIAALAEAPQKKVLLVTGAHSLATFINHPKLSEKDFFVRLLPTADSIAEAKSLGLGPDRICAQMGPFSEAENLAQWQRLGIEGVVTKADGEAGGLPAKVSAAEKLALPLWIWQRPVRQASEEASTPAGALAWAAALPKGASRG